MGHFCPKVKCKGHRILPAMDNHGKLMDIFSAASGHIRNAGRHAALFKIRFKFSDSVKIALPLSCHNPKSEP